MSAQPERGHEPDATTSPTDASAPPDQTRTETTMDARTSASDADDAPTARLDEPSAGARPDAEQHPDVPVDASATASGVPAGAAGDAPEPDERGVRVGTVVWGLVIAAIGVGLIATVAGARFDVELAVIALVAAAGVALLVGSVAKSLRRR
ncbi:hypothetical protein GXB85_01330 [Cellulomonas sp. APG4]|uniref:hypothetical protein n=1 Tax=Cellulomonas sp. APG4 TaxID=1538656 RepID=UPI0013795A4F|nr:hypothetical protein [Cellulomonas sp. APG4]NCT89600.1 hypothetical protein [Cellulomonas sp. APG4]